MIKTLKSLFVRRSPQEIVQAELAYLQKEHMESLELQRVYQSTADWYKFRAQYCAEQVRRIEETFDEEDPARDISAPMRAAYGVSPRNNSSS